MGLSTKLITIGKYLDQPSLIKKINNTVPLALVGGGLAYCGYDTLNTRKSEQKNKLIQNASILTFTIGSALLATKGLSIKGREIFEGLIELPHLHWHDMQEVIAKVTDEKTKHLINKVEKGKILNLKEIKTLGENLNTIFMENRAIKRVIPDAHNHGAFEELGKLSILGLIPIIGGIAGGVTGDILTKQNVKKKLPDKIKEGTYQYLNNIFLCNVGAGLAMVAMNKLKVKSKAVRFAGMLAGVIGAGLLAGNCIANIISKTIINPLFDGKNAVKQNLKTKLKNLNSERHPEAVDLSLHIDDIASVGFLSGLKWIGPILPALYSVSGYRAGIGYRNGGQGENKQVDEIKK